MRAEGHLNSVDRGRIVLRTQVVWEEVRAGALGPGTESRGRGGTRQRDKISENAGSVGRAESREREGNAGFIVVRSVEGGRRR
jgi:hypothetical protein